VKLVQVRRMRWVVYDKRGKIVIITHHRRIAEWVIERGGCG
jgi:c-di-AMP phosphodiesterase-like protein